MSQPPPGAGAFGRLLGAEIPEPLPEEGFEVRMRVDERHENQDLALHGGVQMSLLDMAMAGAVKRTLQPGEKTSTVSMTIDFMRPVARGVILARGRLDRRGRTVAFPSAELYDAEGRLAARASGIWAIRPATP